MTTVNKMNKVLLCYLLCVCVDYVGEIQSKFNVKTCFDRFFFWVLIGIIPKHLMTKPVVLEKKERFIDLFVIFIFIDF